MYKECKQACNFDPLRAVIGVENGPGKMKVNYSESTRYIELVGSHFNADGGSNLNAELQTGMESRKTAG